MLFLALVGPIIGRDLLLVDQLSDGGTAAEGVDVWYRDKREDVLLSLKDCSVQKNTKATK